MPLLTPSSLQFLIQPDATFAAPGWIFVITISTSAPGFYQAGQQLWWSLKTSEPSTAFSLVLTGHPHWRNLRQSASAYTVQIAEKTGNLVFCVALWLSDCLLLYEWSPHAHIHRTHNGKWIAESNKMREGRRTMKKEQMKMGEKTIETHHSIDQKEHYGMGWYDDSAVQYILRLSLWCSEP